jgi:hypothetical protein
MIVLSSLFLKVLMGNRNCRLGLAMAGCWVRSLFDLKFKDSKQM